MAYECCLSVGHLHSKGLMHCDIKSLNFLVSDDLSIRLADLGEARMYAGLRNSEVQSLPRQVILYRFMYTCFIVSIDTM